MNIIFKRCALLKRTSRKTKPILKFLGSHKRPAIPVGATWMDLNLEDFFLPNCLRFWKQTINLKTNNLERTPDLKMNEHRRQKSSSFPVRTGENKKENVKNAKTANVFRYLRPAIISSFIVISEIRRANPPDTIYNEITSFSEQRNGPTLSDVSSKKKIRSISRDVTTTNKSTRILCTQE